MNKYLEYKPSGLNSIDQIPEKWKCIALKRLVKIKITDGPHETPEFISEGIPFISAESIKEGKIDFNYKRGNISKEIHEIYSKKTKPLKNDIFIVKSGSTTGKIAIVESDIEFNIWSPLALVRANENLVDFRFLYNTLQSIFFQKQIQNSWSFGTQPNIGMGVLENLIIILPSLPEQQAIANFLDKKTFQIDTLIQKKKDMIKLLKEEREVLINNAVIKGIDPTVKLEPSNIEWIGEIPEHWKLVSLKWISKIYSGGTPSKVIDKYWQNGTIPWLNSGTVNQFFIEDPSEFITEEALQNSSAKWIPKGSIVIALAGQGKTKGMVAQVMIECTCNQSMGVIIPKEKILSRFLLYYLKRNYQNIRNLGGGDKRDGINLEMVGGIPIPLITIEEQQSIVTHIETETSRIDKTISKIEQEIRLIQEYKTALISEAVTGKIDVRGEV